MLEYTLYKAYQALFTFLTVKLGIIPKTNPFVFVLFSEFVFKFSYKLNTASNIDSLNEHQKENRLYKVNHKETH